MEDKSISDVVGVVGVARESISASLSGIPEPLRRLFEPVIQRNLRLLERKLRVPNIALYGRTGSGKSSLINAIMDAQLASTSVCEATTMVNSQSYEYERQGWKLKFTDSRGVGDMQNEEACNQAMDYIVREKVDILLFIAPADERSYVDKDVKFLDALKTTYKRKYSVELPIILVLSKVDRIDPISEWNPPYDLDLRRNLSLKPETSRQLKEINIIKCLKVRTDEYKSLTTKYVPVCASWDDFTDRRYNIDQLAMTIYDELPDSAKPGFAAVTTVSEIKKSIALKVTWTSAVSAGLAGLSPVPFIGSAVIFTLLTTLVSFIARLGQGNQDKNRVATQFIENMGVYGGGLTVAMLASELNFTGVGVPAAIAASMVVAAIILAVGQAAIRHFIENVSLEDSKKFYEQQNQFLKSKFMEAFSGNPSEVARKLQNISSELGIDIANLNRA